MPVQTATASGKIVVLLNDLMFQVKIEEAARRCGLSCVFTGSRLRLLEELAGGASLIVVDLAIPGVDAVALIAQLKSPGSGSTVPILAYVPHVDVDLKARAVAAGCDAVIARSAFVQNLPALLLRFASPAMTQPDLSLNT